MIESDQTKQLMCINKEDLDRTEFHSESLFNHIQVRNHIYYFCVEKDGKDDKVYLKKHDLSNQDYDL